MGAFFKSARAIEIRWRSPPESFPPVRRGSDQIPYRQPDADIGQHSQHHGNRRESKPQKCQSLIAAGIFQQHCQVALFLLFHTKYLNKKILDVQHLVF